MDPGNPAQEPGEHLMNTREENVAAAMREEQEIAEQQELRRHDLKWAQEWCDGEAHCPRCGGSDFHVVDENSEGRVRYETLRCKTDPCGARWQVEFRETALVILRDDGEDDWIEFPIADTPTAAQAMLDSRSDGASGQPGADVVTTAQE
jgi:hypothetical protein